MVIGTNGSYELRDLGIPYGANFGVKNDPLRHKNTFNWEIFS